MDQGVGESGVVRRIEDDRFANGLADDLRMMVEPRCSLCRQEHRLGRAPRLRARRASSNEGGPWPPAGRYTDGVESRKYFDQASAQIWNRRP